MFSKQIQGNDVSQHLTQEFSFPHVFRYNFPDLPLRSLGGNSHPKLISLYETLEVAATIFQTGGKPYGLWMMKLTIKDGETRHHRYPPTELKNGGRLKGIYVSMHKEMARFFHHAWRIF